MKKSIFHVLVKLFSRKATLRTVDPEQIRRDRIRVEQTELKYTREIEELEKQKEALFRKGVEGSSDRQRVQLARKIKQLDGMVQAKDRQLALLSKNVQVLNSLMQLKENERMLSDLGMAGVVDKMNLAEVQSYVERATIEGQFQMERFTKLLESVNEAEGLYEAGELDSDTQSILDIMATVSSNQSDVAIRSGLTQMDQLLHKEPANG